MIHKIPNPELQVFKIILSNPQPVLFVYFLLLLLFSSKPSVKIRNWEFMKLCGENLNWLQKLKS